MATYYWNGGAGGWSDVTNWVTFDGPTDPNTGDPLNPPGPGDDAWFTTGGTVTGTTIDVGTIDTTGTPITLQVGTLTANAIYGVYLTVTSGVVGDFTGVLVSGMLTAQSAYATVSGGTLNTNAFSGSVTGGTLTASSLGALSEPAELGVSAGQATVATITSAGLQISGGTVSTQSVTENLYSLEVSGGSLMDSGALSFSSDPNESDIWGGMANAATLSVQQSTLDVLGAGQLTISSNASITSGLLLVGVPTGISDILGAPNNGGTVSFKGDLSISGAPYVYPALGSSALGDLIVGTNGSITVTGTTTVDNGANVLANGGTLIANNASTVVGNVGTGSLQIFGGATATLANVVVAQTSSSGSSSTPSALEVSETGSDLKAASLVVGQSGYGTFDVQNAATTEITGNVTGGQDDGSVGTIYVQGLTPPPDSTSTPNLNVGGALAVGVNGTGHLYVQGAGKLSADSLAIGSLGDGSADSGTGTLYIDTGGYVKVTGIMTVEGTSGSGPNGSVSDSGGTVTVGGDLDLGDVAGSIVKMTVQGESEIGYSTPSDVTVAGNVYLGVGSNLYISQGGTFEWGGEFTIGGGTQANTGGVTISSGGSLQNSVGAFIDNAGHVIVNDGSTLVTGNVTLDPVGQATALLEADGGTITIDGSLSLAGAGNSQTAAGYTVGGQNYAWAVASDGGTIDVGGNSQPLSGTFEIDATGVVVGSGYIAADNDTEGAAVVDNGTIEAQQNPGGYTLRVGSPIEGYGIAKIDLNAILAVGAVDSSITIQFTGAFASLEILNGAFVESEQTGTTSFAAPITGFEPTDKIILDGVQVVPPQSISAPLLPTVGLVPWVYTNNILYVPISGQGDETLNIDVGPLATAGDFTWEATTSPIASDIFLISYTAYLLGANLIPLIGEPWVIDAADAASGHQNVLPNAVLGTSLSAAQPNLIELTMSEAVTVADGTPILSFNDGGTAVYDAANSNSTTLAFDYTPGPIGVTELDVTSVNLNGAAIQDSNGNNADFSSLVGLPLATMPVVNFISATTNNNATEIGVGQVVTITVTASEDVTVTGVPTLQLSDNEVATYQSGSGTDELTFTYTVQSADITSNLQVTGLNLPNGASIEDQAGNNLSGTFIAELGIAIVGSPLAYIYHDVLQRSPSSVELNAATALQSSIGNAAVIASIVDSPEAQYNVYPIVQIIELATGSLPTAAQLSGWVPFVETNGLLQGPSQTNPLLDQMAEAFVASTQFGNTYNGGAAVDPNATITASIVSAIIQAATGLAATQPQINAWLSTGETIDQVFVDFALGDQYTAYLQTTVQQYLTGAAASSGLAPGSLNATTVNDGLTAAQVQGAYQAVLQRAPISGETNAALSIDSTLGNVAAFAAIVDSPEALQYVYPVTQIILLATGNLPTAGQLAGWVPAVEAGTSLDDMALAFVASSTFGDTYNGGTAVDPNAPITATIVSAIIDAATGIVATQTQVNAWLATGETIDQVFVSFALGDQYSAHIEGTVQSYLDAAAINGAGLTTVDGVNATGALTLGTSATPLTGNNLTILGGSGSLTVVASGNGDTITELSTSTAGGTITASGSNDIINLANGANTITLTGDLTGATTQNGTTTSGIAMTTLGNAVNAASDQIVFNNAATEVLAGTNVLNVTAAGSSLAKALDIAAADAAASQAGGQIAAHTGVIAWFQLGGNTYLVEAVNGTGSAAAHGALTASDEVIKIVGQVDLSGEGLTGHTLTL
jgi:hypothetical protein